MDDVGEPPPNYIEWKQLLQKEERSEYANQSGNANKQQQQQTSAGDEGEPSLDLMEVCYIHAYTILFTVYLARLNTPQVQR